MNKLSTVDPISLSMLLALRRVRKAPELLLTPLMVASPVPGTAIGYIKLSDYLRSPAGREAIKSIASSMRTPPPKLLFKV